MSKDTPIPQHEPEVFQAGVKRRHNDDERVPTTSLAEMIVEGVRLVSRFRKASEYEAMASAVRAMLPPMQKGIAEIFCDSKAGAVYSITLRCWGPIGISLGGYVLIVPPDLAAHYVGRVFATYLCDFSEQRGYNGITVEGPHGPKGYSKDGESIFLDPFWVDDEFDPDTVPF